MLLPIPKYGQKVRWCPLCKVPCSGPQTMPFPRLAMCDCITPLDSFPLENSAGLLLPCFLLLSQIPGNTTLLCFFWGLRSEWQEVVRGCHWAVEMGLRGTQRGDEQPRFNYLEGLKRGKDKYQHFSQALSLTFWTIVFMSSVRFKFLNAS